MVLTLCSSVAIERPAAAGGVWWRIAQTARKIPVLWRSTALTRPGSSISLSPKTEVHSWPGTFAAASDTNHRYRKENQDRGTAARNKRGDILLAVLDGMGGEGPHGATAAAIGQKMLTARWSAATGAESIEQMVRDTSATVAERVPGAGSTVTAAIIKSNGHLATLNVGDSRVYRLRGDHLAQLTTDHAIGGALTEFLGKDHRGEKPAVALEDHGPMQSGDRILVASDGLHGKVSSEEIAAVLKKPGSTKALADELVALAKARGSRDNITVQVYEHD